MIVMILLRPTTVPIADSCTFDHKVEDDELKTGQNGTLNTKMNSQQQREISVLLIHPFFIFRHNFFSTDKRFIDNPSSKRVDLIDHEIWN